MQKKLIKLADVRPPGPLINVDVGAIINVIRSSLDMMMTSVALRHSYTDVERTYFPIAKSHAHFIAGNYKGREAVESLPDWERAIIEDCRPWRGGNDDLIALHDLDVMRKHRKLIDVKLIPWAIAVSPAAIKCGLEIVHVWPGFKEDAVIGWSSIDHPDCYPDLSMLVQFDEAIFPTNKHLMGALADFATLAYRIIERFDF